MLVPAVLLGVAVVLLMATLAPRLSPVSQALTVLVVGYVLGYDAWHADAGPIPLTLDRLALLGVVGGSCWKFYRGATPTPQPIGLDWLIGLLCGWLTVSCLLNRPPDGVELPTSPLFRLVVSFWAPATLYAVLRTSPIDSAEARRLMTGLACLGVYLGLTAVLETAGVWSLVFPRYIANPDLGLHFGRARGPALNSVSLGVHLSVCCAAAWLLLPRASRAMQVFWFGACLLMAVGVLLSFTRSTWIGLAGTAVTVMCLQLPRGWRLPSFATACVLGGLLLAVGKDAIVGLEREDSGSVSAHSVQQRAAFAYVSAQMVRDYPLWGAGFGRYYDKKLPYLNDRRQSFELESIRPLHHHNTFLGLLVETGMLGLAAFVGVLAGFGWVGWRLANDPHVGEECQRLGLLLIGVVVNYLPSALFHDLSLVHSEEWLLFTIAGAATGCWLNAPRRVPSYAVATAFQVTAPPASLAGAPVGTTVGPTVESLVPQPVVATTAGLAPQLATHRAMTDRVKLFGMAIDRLDLAGATARLLDWATDDGPPRGCRYVVTPNVDHAVMYQHDARLREAYRDAAMVVADGAPLVAVSRWLGKPLPERVAGSDLTPALLAAASARAAAGGRPLRLFLLGAGPGVAEVAAKKIAERWPGVETVGVYCPPLGFEKSDAENARIVAAVNATRPDVLLVGLGAPKQELWVQRFHRLLDVRVALCAGATIDFLAGEKRRSPRWMQRAGLEWAHRLASEPRRLAKRYARDAWVFPRLVWNEYRGGFGRGPVAR